jgi:cell shape-determining protein MreD
MIRDKRLAVGMGAAFVLGILWGVYEGGTPGEIFLNGSLAVGFSVITWPLWRPRKED